MSTIKEEIHALSEEMLTNLGKLVAIDSQLAPAKEGMPFGEALPKHLRWDFRSHRSLALRL